MPEVKEKVEQQKYFTIHEKFEVGDLTIHPFAIPHDAVNPCGFTIFQGDRQVSIATDLGHMDAKLIKNLQESSFILLEANYDPNILKCSHYPYALKQRIAGPNGHLSNESARKSRFIFDGMGIKKCNVTVI